MGSIFFEITIIVCLASLLSILFRLLKQPTILAYILTGIIVGPFGQLQFGNQEIFRTLAELGITFLLFMVGLELKLGELRSVGKVAVITGIAQIVFTSLVGYAIAILLGFSSLAALYIAVALTFSSTIIIVKLLSDKKDLKSLYGKIAVGFLLVQDFVAILILMVLSGFNQANGTAISFADFGLVLLKGFLLFAVILYLSRKIFPRLTDIIAKSPETLFLFSIAWAFFASAVVSSAPIGFSIEIGGFLAGLALANSSENFQIAARIRALRDFFITIFFVLLGMNMVFANLGAVFLPALILAAFVLIGNPIIVMIIMGLLRYRKRTSFFAGLTVAQISEFSLIVVFMGNKLGHVSNEVVALVTLVGVITFALSSYMILGNNTLYRWLGRYLNIFERKDAHEERIGKHKIFKEHIVLVGANRIGQSILDSLKSLNHEVVVVDFDPDIIKRLEGQNIDSFFGDITDLDIQEVAQLVSAKLVISTVPDIEDNLLLLKGVKKNKNRVKVIVVAQDDEEARQLYKEGADYVVLPHLAGGRHIAKIISENKIENIGRLR
ncbi:MAG: cation:proton antiporter [Candidatus Levybacteria bacterium]|nr:cation:proton antiporter [Candidatus Levybacteria bacterium]